MTDEEVYNIWRPQSSIWSQWVKPVLFGFLTPTYWSAKEKTIPDWQVPLLSCTMIIVDLPGSTSVECGIALARNGYRPVPLFNACLLSGADEYETGVMFRPILDLRPILYSLCRTARELEHVCLEPDAPPAFLLDADRFAEGISPDPGEFNNRSFISEDDFPIPTLLQRIRQVVIVQQERKIRADLLHVVRKFQERGIRIAIAKPWVQWQTEPLEIRKPTVFERITRVWQSLAVTPNAAGDFGRVIPHHSG